MKHDIANLLFAGVALFGLWFLFFLGWRWHRIDCARFDLFRLRDELFDAALKGPLSFDDRCYGLLRLSINGAIRFAHRTSLWSMLLIFLFTRNADRKWSFAMRWKGALEELRPEARQQAAIFLVRLNAKLFLHMVLASPLLAIVLTPFVVSGIAVYALVSTVQRRKAELHRLRDAVTESYDSAAYAEGALAYMGQQQLAAA